jgi:Helicase associated domain
MLKYTELQQYKIAYGHCDVATKYGPNPALGRWVSTQRSEYKILQRDGRSKHMTQSKIAMLNNLGFRWEMIPAKSSSPSSGNANSSSGED